MPTVVNDRAEARKRRAAHLRARAKVAKQTARLTHGRDRVSNGRDILPGVDGRSSIARRYREITSAILTDNGGPEFVSEARTHLVRRFAAVAVQAERIEAELVNGEEIDIYAHMLLCSTAARLASRIGLDRIPRDITPTLNDYLRPTERPAPADPYDDVVEAEVVEANA
jgi:hypothetical protein